MIIGQKQQTEEKELLNFSEIPREVQKYLNVINPIRSVFFFPKYGLIFKKIALFKRRSIHRLSYLKSPSTLVRKLKVRLKLASGKNTGKRR